MNDSRRVNAYDVVKRGDTLSAIVGKFDVDLDDLLRWNSLSTKSVLRLGQKLRVG